MTEETLYHSLHAVMQNHITQSHLAQVSTADTLTRLLSDCGAKLRAHGWDMSRFPGEIGAYVARHARREQRFRWPGDWLTETCDGQWQLYQALIVLLNEVGEEMGVPMDAGVRVLATLLGGVCVELVDDDEMLADVISGVVVGYMQKSAT
jgi:hypothetical protein